MKTLEWEDNKLKLIDQTKLPDELTYIYCETYQEVIVAIKDMIVRGAPAIGVSAAYGLALADLSGEDMEKAAKEMRAARPTAVNLMWAVDRVMASDDILEEAHKMAEGQWKIWRRAYRLWRYCFDSLQCGSSCLCGLWNRFRCFQGCT